MKHPKISVILPVLNNERFVDRCIASVLRQTYQDFELLIMVGRGTDRSLERCVAWQKKDERIIIVSRKDSSLSDARNYAVPITKGKYLAYIDADDEYDPTFLSALVAPLEADDNVEISCCGCSFSYADGKSGNSLPNGDGEFDVDAKTFLRLIPNQAVWLKMYRKQWWMDHQLSMYDGFAEDISLQIMIAAIAKKIYCIRKPLYHKDMGNPDSVSVNFLLRSFVDTVRGLMFAAEYLQQRGRRAALSDLAIKHMIFSRIQTALTCSIYHPSVAEPAREFFQMFYPAEVSKIRYARRMPARPCEILACAGRVAKHVIRQMGHRAHFRYIIDNHAKEGQTLDGLPVRSFEVLREEPMDTPILIASTLYECEITQQLKAMGFGNVYFIGDVFDEEGIRKIRRT